MKNQTSYSLQRNVYRYALGTAAVILIPVLGMQVSSEWDWNLFDFVIIGTLLMGTGLTFEVVSQKFTKIEHRLVIAAFLLAAMLLVWAELAVGVFNTPFAGS